MKRKLTTFLLSAFVIIIAFIGNGATIKASGDYTGSNLTLTQVEDIDVYNDYIINYLTIDNTLMENRDGGQVYKITLAHDGFVSLLIVARNVTATRTQWSNGKLTNTNVSDAKLSVTAYRDRGLLYGVTPTITATGLTKGESAQKIALDEGTYYIVVQGDKYSYTTNGATTTETKVQGTAELIVYYQDIGSNEVYRPSNVGKENDISIDNQSTGILTATNPKDYYKFTLDNKALVKFNFMYGSTKGAKFVLYSNEREELVTKMNINNNVWYNIEKYLEPGTYYCSLETTTLNDGGKYNLLITQTVYPLKLKQINKTKNSYVTVSTIDEPKEIRVVKGKLTNSEMTSNKWTGGVIITETQKFGVNQTGYYTVRVTDVYGNMFMQSIEVLSCDKKAPKKPVVNSYKKDSLIISGKAEKSSTVVITINQRIIYTCTTNSKGNFKYTLPNYLAVGSVIVVTAQDISGNISSKATITVK